MPNGTLWNSNLGSRSDYFDRAAEFVANSYETGQVLMVAHTWPLIRSHLDLTSQEDESWVSLRAGMGRELCARNILEHYNRGMYRVISSRVEEAPVDEPWVHSITEEYRKGDVTITLNASVEDASFNIRGIENNTTVSLYKSIKGSFIENLEGLYKRKTEVTSVESASTTRSCYIVLKEIHGGRVEVEAVMPEDDEVECAVLRVSIKEIREPAVMQVLLKQVRRVITAIVSN